MIRLRGFVLLVNSLLPVLIAVGLAWGAVSIWGAVKAEVQPPVAQLIDDAKNLATHARAAARTVENTAVILHDEAVKVKDSATAIVEPLTSFTIDIPPFNVPFLNVSLCKVNLDVRQALNIGSCFPRLNVLGKISSTINAGLATAFAKPRAEFAKISASIQRAQDELDKLDPLADAFRAQAAQFEARARALGDARDRIADHVGGIVRIAAWVLGALGLWAVLVYLLWIQTRLAHGWHMLRHGTTP